MSQVDDFKEKVMNDPSIREELVSLAGQPRGELMAQSAHRGEEAEPHILRAHMRGEILKQRLVLGTHRAQPDNGAVGQLPRRFELVWP